MHRCADVDIRGGSTVAAMAEQAFLDVRGPRKRAGGCSGNGGEVGGGGGRGSVGRQSKPWLRLRARHFTHKTTDNTSSNHPH